MSTDVHPWLGVRQFQRHSLVLLVAGTVYVAIGGAFLTTPITPERERSLQYALMVLDFHGWGMIFITAGVLAVISSKWPPVSETWGYTILTGLSVLWAGFYVPAVLFGSAPNSVLTGTLTWALLGFLWWAISGLVNPKALVALMNQNRALQSENLALHAELRRCKGQDE